MQEYKFRWCGQRVRITYETRPSWQSNSAGPATFLTITVSTAAADKLGTQRQYQHRTNPDIVETLGGPANGV